MCLLQKDFVDITWICHFQSKSCMHFLACVRNFAMKYSTLVFSMRTGVRRRGNCESRAPRSLVRNTTSANNGYIAWAERLLLANDGNFFRGYVYPSPDDGFFRRQERGFPVARRAINDTAHFSKNRETGETKFRRCRGKQSMDRTRLSHARLERLHDWFKTWEFSGDSWLGKRTRLIWSHQFGRNFVNRQRVTQDMNNGMLHSWPIAL